MIFSLSFLSFVSSLAWAFYGYLIADPFVKARSLYPRPFSAAPVFLRRNSMSRDPSIIRRCSSVVVGCLMCTFPMYFHPS